MRIAIVMRWLAPYRNLFYDEIGRRLGASAEIAIFTAFGGGDSLYPWEEDTLRPSHARVICLPSYRFKSGWLPLMDWPNRRLWKQLDRFDPTHVWIHEFSPYVLLALAWAKARGRTSFVSTEIGDNFPGRFAPSNKRFHHLVMRSCDGVIAHTQRAHETGREFGRRALFVPHAIDTAVFTPRAAVTESAPGGKGKVRVLQVGILNERKGVDLLLKAFRRCVDVYPDSLELVLVGGGDPAWTQDLIRSLGLEKHTLIRPFIQGPALIAEYQQADIFVLASREDTYGVVVHEAAACGLPLVTSRYAGASETLVVEGQTGFVVDPYDAESFGNAIGRLAADADLRKTLGEEARRHAELFSVQASARKAVTWLRESS